jgi:putative nucleotidyltransferase with HDIG domain
MSQAAATTAGSTQDLQLPSPPDNWQRRVSAVSIGDPLESLRAIDEFTYNHSVKVASLGVSIASELGVADLRPIHSSGLYHDFGKVAVPWGVLNKPGKLSDDERGIIQLHPEETARILTETGRGDLVGATLHHERLNGTGYPFGLRGAEVPLDARIIAIADVFDAPTEDRPYRGPMPFAKALGILDEEVEDGKLDGDVLGSLRVVLGQFGRSVLPTNNQLLQELEEVTKSAIEVSGISETQDLEIRGEE